jgi:large subunit ribosomal protein L15
MPTQKSAAKAAAVSADSPSSEMPRLTLEGLAPAPGSTKKRNRIGRGRAHGQGKTCGHGHNGEGQRAGQSSKRGFEGGQMPAYRRLPKLPGFNVPNPRIWLELTTGELNRLIKKLGSTLTYDVIAQTKHWTLKTDGIRIIDGGALDPKLAAKLTVEAHYVSPAALAKIEAVGGKVLLKTPSDASETESA